MARGCPAPSFQRERLGRAGRVSHTCNSRHLTLGHLMRPGSRPSGHPARQFSKWQQLSKMASQPQRVCVVVTSCHVVLCSRQTTEAGPGWAGFRGSFLEDWHVHFSLNRRGSWDLPCTKQSLWASLPGSSFRQHPGRNCFWPGPTGFLELLRMTGRALLGPVFRAE